MTANALLLLCGFSAHFSCSIAWDHRALAEATLNQKGVQLSFVIKRDSLEKLSSNLRSAARDFRCKSF